MRSASPELIAYINQIRAQTDAQLTLANCFLFQLATGVQLAYTDVDYPVTLNGVTYTANALQVSGLKFKCAIGVDPDEQQITLAAKSTDTIGGVPALAAIGKGILDGCEVSRSLVFFDGRLGPIIGSVLLFKGRVGRVDSVGRTRAKITVNSDLILLDIDMPRNLYAPGCQHVLYDAGCTLSAANFGTEGNVESADNATIVWSGANSNYTQGKLLFTSGINNGLAFTVKAVSGNLLALAYPMEDVPAAGDSFTVYFGCDHSMGTCRDKFNNLQNFRGFPFIPPPTFSV
jgi:uncharacterized phage protein (TIGR02218 family)